MHNSFQLIVSWASSCVFLILKVLGIATKPRAYFNKKWRTLAKVSIKCIFLRFFTNRCFQGKAPRQSSPNIYIKCIKMIALILCIKTIT